MRLVFVEHAALTRHLAQSPLDGYLFLGAQELGKVPVDSNAASQRRPSGVFHSILLRLLPIRPGEL
jgi:hypothetical protein